MNLKLRYSIIIIDLSLKNPKIQELPGTLPPGKFPTLVHTNHNRYQEKERVWGNANAEQHDLTVFHRIFIFVKLFALPTSFKAFVLFYSFKSILSTKIVIFSYPKSLSFSVLTFIKWRLNTKLLANMLRNVVFSI